MIALNVFPAFSLRSTSGCFSVDIRQLRQGTVSRQFRDIQSSLQVIIIFFNITIHSLLLLDSSVLVTVFQDGALYWF